MPRERSSVLVSWVRMHDGGAVGTATVLLVLVSLVVDGRLGTPQASGGQADLTLSSVMAAAAGVCAVGLIGAAEPIAEARAGRPLTRARAAYPSLVAALGCLGFAWTGERGSAGASLTYATIAAGLLTVTRFAGHITAALVFVAYMGAVLFTGATSSGVARWWAVPLRQEGGGLAPWVAVAALALALGVTLRPPRLPSSHRRSPRLARR